MPTAACQKRLSALSSIVLGLATVTGACSGEDAGGRGSDRGPSGEAASRSTTVSTVEYSPRPAIDYADSSDLDPRRSDTLRIAERYGDSDSFGSISDVYPLPGILVVSDNLMDPHLAIVRLADGEVIHRFGPDGEGPGEFQNVTNLFRAEAEPLSVGAFDVGNQRLSFVEIRATDHRPALRDDLPFRAESMVIHAYPLVEDRYVGGGGCSASHRLGVYDSLGHPLERIQTAVPDVVTPVMRKAVLDRSVLRTHIARRPGRDQYALAFLELNRLEIVDVAGKAFRIVHGPDQTEPAFTTEGPRPITIDWENHERAYFSVATTDDRIYAAFCGCIHAPSRTRKRDVPRPRTVHVYDWTGALVGELLLDREVGEIAVSPGDSVLYGSYQTPVPYIGKWNLPEWISD